MKQGTGRQSSQAEGPSSAPVVPSQVIARCGAKLRASLVKEGFAFLQDNTSVCLPGVFVDLWPPGLCLARGRTRGAGGLSV